MARTIASPGVEITEFDQSNYTVTPAGTTFLLMGFADKGPTDEILELTDFEEFKEVYGQPTNAAERYFYHSANQLYSSNANVYCARLPYGKEKGEGFGNKYGALAYPIASAFNLSSFTADELSSKNITILSSNFDKVFNMDSEWWESVLYGQSEYIIYYYEISGYPTSAFEYDGNIIRQALGTGIGLDTSIQTINAFNNGGILSDFGTNVSNISDANYIVFGAPKHVDLTQTEYLSVADGLIWNDSLTATPTSLNDYGFIVLNDSQTTINDQFEGYYVGVCDNEKLEPGSGFDSILKVDSINKNFELSSLPSITDNYIELPETRMDFELSAGPNSNINSISEVLENIPSFNIFGPEFTDMVSFGLFKLRKTVFSTDVIKLDYSLQEAYMGSFDYWRQLQNENGGPAKRIFLSNLVENNSNNLKVFINTNISNKNGKSWLDINGNPTKAIKFNEDAKALFPVGSYSPTTANTKKIGELPSKIDRVLSKLEDTELFDLDGTVEAGLGTIWVYTLIKDGRIVPGQTGILDLSAVPNAENVFDDTIDVYNVVNNDGLGKGFYNTGLTELGYSANEVRSAYTTIANKFNTFATKTRKDHIFILDPLRFTCVKGAYTKVLDAVQPDGEPYNFSQHVYWPMRYQFMSQNTSYGAVYANWGKVYDGSSDSYIWLPCSGTMASIIAYSSEVSYPWFAPAGFNRGVITTLDEVAIYPNQKQRDQLYKISINPIAFFPNDGMVVWGQKTLQSKPSAFDRLNVRRLFLYLEKATKRTLKYFVFEPNSYFTRTQVFNTLDPLFNQVKTQQGMYDYRIVCSEANNTGFVIDNNEMVVDIYIAPTKSAEYILANFYATRTNGVTTTEQS